MKQEADAGRLPDELVLILLTQEHPYPNDCLHTSPEGPTFLGVQSRWFPAIRFLMVSSSFFLVF